MCRYRVAFSPSSPAVNSNTVTATGDNVAPDSDDAHTAVVRVAACSGADRTVPDLIGLDEDAAQDEWADAGFTGTLDTTSIRSNNDVETQSHPAYSCMHRTSTMSVDD
jgi:hypothetical protein